MTRLQRLQLRQSEQRQALGVLLDSDEQDPEAVAKITGELRSLETRVQAGDSR